VHWGPGGGAPCPSPGPGEQHLQAGNRLTIVRPRSRGLERVASLAVITGATSRTTGGWRTCRTSTPPGMAWCAAACGPPSNSAPSSGTSARSTPTPCTGVPPGRGSHQQQLGCPPGAGGPGAEEEEEEEGSASKLARPRAQATSHYLRGLRWSGPPRKRRMMGTARSPGDWPFLRDRCRLPAAPQPGAAAELPAALAGRHLPDGRRRRPARPGVRGVRGRAGHAQGEHLQAAHPAGHPFSMDFSPEERHTILEA
jgi:hypothetical protein